MKVLQPRKVTDTKLLYSIILYQLVSLHDYKLQNSPVPDI